jgi:hypothetical protein
MSSNCSEPSSFEDMVQKEWSAQSAGFKEAKKLIQRQIRISQNNLIINPRSSWWMPYWDFTSFAMLFFTAVVTPVEVVFTRDGDPGWFFLNLLVNLFFFCDLILNFFMAYQEDANKGTQWVTDRRLIIRHYVRTWFVLDLLTVVPFSMIAKIVAEEPILCIDGVGVLHSNKSCNQEAEAGTNSAELLRLIRTLRLLRLVKLLRILRASRIITRWQDFFGFSYAQLSLGALTTMLFTLLHWYACLWSFAALGGLWVHTEGIDLATDSTWIEAMGMQEWQERDQDFEIYVIALYVSIVAMFGGVGSVPPSNRFEYGVLVFILFTGCFFWAYVISTLCALLSTLNPHKTEFRNTMDALNHFMDDYHLTTDHRVRIRQFFRASRDFTRRSSYHELMSKMSERLRGDTSLIIGVTVLSKVWYFDLNEFNLEFDFLAHVSLALQPKVYEAKDRFDLTDLTVLTKGTLCMGLRILIKGACVGLDCIIKPGHRGLLDQSTLQVACLTFAEVQTVSRETIFGIAENFPKAKVHLHWAARRALFRACVRRAYRDIKKERAAQLRAVVQRKRWMDAAKASADEVAAQRNKSCMFSSFGGVAMAKKAGSAHGHGWKDKLHVPHRFHRHGTHKKDGEAWQGAMRTRGGSTSKVTKGGSKKGSHSFIDMDAPARIPVPFKVLRCENGGSVADLLNQEERLTSGFSCPTEPSPDPKFNAAAGVAPLAGPIAPARQPTDSSNLLLNELRAMRRELTKMSERFDALEARQAPAPAPAAPANPAPIEVVTVVKPVDVVLDDLPRGTVLSRLAIPPSPSPAAADDNEDLAEGSTVGPLRSFGRLAV